MENHAHGPEQFDQSSCIRRIYPWIYHGIYGNAGSIVICTAGSLWWLNKHHCARPLYRPGTVGCPLGCVCGGGEEQGWQGTGVDW